MKKILVIDNYDSFVYNLVCILQKFRDFSVDIFKNDKISLEEVQNYNKILLSPGPGIPQEAGIMPLIIKEFASQKSILGVCLGHQAIAECFGTELVNLPEPLHGVSSPIQIKKSDYLFEGIPNSFQIGHYHSWVVSEKLGQDLESLAVDDKNNLMAIRHQHYDLRGVQFHPESILTEYGEKIIQNWLTH
ncbi:MAG: aminodeoxychorismate/anthranilate synthase component II [Thermonemataceae bacterium]|nr:aminodeoxychorismate/anthranilate synthase component II [Thermonemataceae bacterium]